MICSKCGLEIETGAAFCGNCGQPVQAATPQVASVPAAPAPVPSPVPPAPAPMATPAAPAPTAAPTVSAPVAGGFAAPQPAVAMAAPGMPGPAYGAPAAFAQPGGGKAIASFVLGIIGLIAWLIPLFGIIFGVLAMIFGTMSTKSPHRKLAITGIVLASITLLLSLMAFVYNIQTQAKQSGTADLPTSSGLVQSAVTADSTVFSALTNPY